MDFKIVNNINYGKEDDKLDNVRRKDYSPFLINRALSYFPDTVLQANNMNMRSFLDVQTQYDYLLNSVRKRKRFSKWHKPSRIEAVPLIREVLECSPKEAEQYAMMLPEKTLNELKGIYGGSSKTKKTSK